jgi:hypothetical protein
LEQQKQSQLAQVTQAVLPEQLETMVFLGLLEALRHLEFGFRQVAEVAG